MSEIIYSPAHAGQEFTNKKGKIIRIRKYHLTDKEMIIARKRWEQEVSKVRIETRQKAGPHFFNPYRYGIYYYQIQSLFLLGCNEWHNLTEILKKLESYTLGIAPRRGEDKKYGYTSAWDKFKTKLGRGNARKCKDYMGRIQENFKFFQRLSKFHPYGYKLYQVCAAVDTKRINRIGFPNGAYFYRLSTYDTMAEALPLRDFSRYKFPKHEKKYVSYRFVGTIITREKKIVGGVVV